MKEHCINKALQLIECILRINPIKKGKMTLNFNESGLTGIRNEKTGEYYSAKDLESARKKAI